MFRRVPFLLILSLWLASARARGNCPPDALAALADRPAQNLQPQNSPAGKFIPITELAAEAAPLVDRAYEIFLTKPRKTAENSKARLQEERLLFREAVEEVFGERQFKVLDTPQGWTVPDQGKRIPLPIHLARVFTFDHHGPYLNYAKGDPDNNEKRNSSKQMLDFIAAEVRGLRGEALENKIQQLQSQFALVSTDNLGDGALGIWIARNLDRVARDPGLRTELAQMTFYEDYGYFGTKTEEVANRSDNPGLKLAVERTNALFAEYDQILKDAKQRNDAPALGVNTSDRIGQLNSAEQNRIIESAVRAVERVLSNQPADRLAVRDAAVRFDRTIEESKKSVAEKSRALQADVAAHLLKTEPGRSQSAIDARLGEFLSDVFITYGLDPNATSGGGRFATWGALPRSHSRSSQVEITPRADGRTNFIFTHAQGRSFEPWFKPAADEIKAIHLARLAAEGASAEALAKANWDVVGRPGPSDFYFSFTGVKLSPVEIVEILMKHAREAKLPAGMEALRKFSAPFYRANDEAATAIRLSENPEHFKGPRLFTDHGSVHPEHLEERVRPNLNVLNQLDKLDPVKDAGRIEFRDGLAHLLIPLHDIGMSAPENRPIHPQLATQTVLDRQFDSVFKEVWNGGRNPLAQRLRGYLPEAALEDAGRTLLAMSNAHSKSTVPREVLADGGAKEFFKVMVHAASTAPAKLLLENKISKLKEKPGNEAEIRALKTQIARLETSGKGESDAVSEAEAEKRFAWVKSLEETPAGKLLWLDIRRALQALSVGDAARPTGDATRTSGGHPIIALDDAPGAVVLIDAKDGGPLVPYFSQDSLHAGEPNVRTSGWDSEGNFRVTLVDGKFGGAEAKAFHLAASAKVVAALAGDGMILGPNQKLVLERPVEGPGFAEEIVAHLRADKDKKTAALAERIVLVEPSQEILDNYAKRQLDIRIENQRFAEARPAEEALSAEEKAGLPSRVRENLKALRVATVQPGEEILTAGSFGDQVFILLSGSLHGSPVAKYSEFDVKPGGMVGEGGAVGIGTRTATITAREPSRLLIIDGETYRRNIFRPLSAEEAAAEIRRRAHRR